MTTERLADEQLVWFASCSRHQNTDWQLANVATELLAARKRITDLEAKMAEIAVLPDDTDPKPTSHEGHVHEWCAGYRYAMRHVKAIIGGEL